MVTRSAGAQFRLNMRRRSFAAGGFALLSLAAFAGCAPDEARVSVRYAPRSDLGSLQPAVAVKAPGLNRALSLAELGATTTAGPFEFATPMSGQLDVEFTLSDHGAAVANGSVRVDLRPDWAWGFRILVDSANPTRLCFGCEGARAFPLAESHRRSAVDSVWIVWGGNSIKHPVVY